MSIPQECIDAEIYLGTNRILARAIEHIRGLGNPECAHRRLNYPDDIIGQITDLINPPALIEEIVAEYHAEQPDPDFLYEQRRDEQMMREAGVR